MGHIIRLLDEDCEYQGHWTLDGEHMQLPSGVTENIVALLTTLAPTALEEVMENE